MGVWLGPRWAANDNQEPLFTITKNGSPAVLNTDYYYAHQTVNGAEQWELALLTDCVINFSRVGKVDFFLVGGGQAGRIGVYDEVSGVSKVDGGYGGNGAKILTDITGTSLHAGVDYVVDIGDGGYWDYPYEVAATPTKFGTLRSSENGTEGGGASRAGGKGARAYGLYSAQSYNADPGGAGDYAFGSSTSLIASLSGRKYGAGGGGAASLNTEGVSYNSNVGGTTGGGAGGTSNNIHGGAGADNTGSGGGGGYTNQDAPTTGNNGGSGILILRDHRG